jgi:hypothetical protein
MDRSVQEGRLQKAVVGTPQVVFEAKRPPPTPAKPSYAPFDSFTQDDDLVYPVPDSEPALLSLSSDFNVRQFFFDGSISCASATILVDSGASASFVSRQWCERNQINPVHFKCYGRLADQSSFCISGKLSHVKRYNRQGRGEQTP